MRAIRYAFLLSACIIANLSQAQYILTLHCEQMDPYIGKLFEVRVTEINTGKEVGRKSISAIDSADFAITLYVLLQSRDYHIDFYADANGNGAYDAPPKDHAWRRVLNNVTANTQINFVPDADYTDITFPDPFPYSTYNAIWGGKWMNLTFGSTDSIQAGILLTCDSIIGFFSTKGVFGNPNEVTFEYADSIPSGTDTDTIHYSPGAPWTGEVLIIDDELHGNLELAGVGLQFTGTVGAKQILALYQVFAGDTEFANGYFYIRELEIESSTPVLEIESYSYLSCFGTCDGFVDLAVSGGQPPYTYDWSTGDVSEYLDSLCAGVYSVTVTDVMGCSVESSDTLIEREPVSITVSGTDESCSGSCDGSIDLDDLGGPFDFFIWNLPLDLSALCAGQYVDAVTGYDLDGCQTIFTITINSPEPLNADVFVTPASCSGSCDGVIELDVSGGTPPYSITHFSDFCEGTYSIFVTDAAGCLLQLDAFVWALSGPSIVDIISVNETNGQSDGSITVIASGGVPPLTYSINSIAYQASNIFTGLSAGTYTVCVKDANGCIECSEFVIQNVTSVDELHAKFSLYPNPVHDDLHIESDIPLSLDILDVQGHLITHIENSSSTIIPMENIIPGLYMLRLSDGYGVEYRKVIVQ